MAETKPELKRQDWIQQGMDELSVCQEELVDLITRMTEVPAPSHDEGDRGRFVAETMKEFGFPVVQIDPVGNVIGFFPGTDPTKVIVSMAHIDTVFPRNTDLSVKRDGNTLAAPGISDNTASVCQMLLVGRVFARHLPLPHPVLLIGNVGEEGLGDLKGARHFCSHVADYDFGGFKLDPANLVFLNIDGGMGQLVNAGIGSRRLRIEYKGEGGHSWGAFGKSSAIHGIGTAIAGIAEIEVPAKPKTSYNVGVVSGGHSVNSIAQDAYMLLDMRSVSTEPLMALEKEVRDVLEAAAEKTNTTYSVEVVGDRPTGSISPEASLVKGIVELGKRHGIDFHLSASSTDSNIPLANGWPAVTMGFKRSENSHRTSEYLYIDSLVPGVTFMLECYEGLLYDRF